MPALFTVEDLINVYTRAQALADGCLVELPADTCKEAGIKFPVAVTSAVFARLIDLTPAARRACNDIAGRTWDVVWMLSLAIRRSRGGQQVNFEVYAVADRVRPTRHALKALCGPGDDGSPCITIMFPEES